MTDMRFARGPIAALALILVSTACTPLDDAMVAIFGRSMRDQNSFDPYENTQLPAENSVPFAAGNYPAGPDRLNFGQPERGVVPAPFSQADLSSEMVNGLENPLASDEESLARGQELYNRYCTVCHSANGIGAEAILAEIHPTVPAYNLSGEVVAGYTDGYIYGMIRVGRGLMPAYGHRIPHFDRWNIVNYVRELQRQAGTYPVSGAGE